MSPFVIEHGAVDTFLEAIERPRRCVGREEGQVVGREQLWEGCEREDVEEFVGMRGEGGGASEDTFEDRGVVVHIAAVDFFGRRRKKRAERCANFEVR